MGLYGRESRRGIEQLGFITLDLQCQIDAEHVIEPEIVAEEEPFAIFSGLSTLTLVLIGVAFFLFLLLLISTICACKSKAGRIQAIIVTPTNTLGSELPQVQVLAPGPNTTGALCNAEQPSGEGIDPSFFYSEDKPNHKQPNDIL